MNEIWASRETGGEQFDGSPLAFKKRSYTFLNILCNDKDLKKAAEYLAPDCILIHADKAPAHGAKTFIEFWGKNLENMPHYHKNIKDIIVEILPEDKGVAKVWIYSRITGIKEGTVTESIDMMLFTPGGLFLQSKDVQRESKQV